MLVDEASAQTAEAIKAGAQAADTLTQQGVLGAVCVLLAIALGVVFWLLIKSYNRYGALIERVAVAIEASKDASTDNAEAVKSQQAAIANLTTALGTLSREFEGETREARHTIRNIAAAVRGIARRLRATPDEDDA